MTTHPPLPTELPTGAATSVGDYPTYAAAQQAEDYLSDHGFPVQHATIIGAELRLVETVTGRITVARAALAVRYHLTVAADHADRLLLQQYWRMT